MRRVEEIDGNGNKIVRFIGQQSFIHDFKTPVRRVVGFRSLDGHGFVDVSGTRVR
jgi:hypothetical protein